MSWGGRQAGRPRAGWKSWASSALAPAALFAAALAVALLATELNRRLDVIRSAPADDVRWTLLQLEVDVIALQSASAEAVAAAARARADAAEIRRPADLETLAEAPQVPQALAQLRGRFDILWSRADVLTKGRAFEEIRKVENVHGALSTIRGFLTDMVVHVDGDDARLLGALDDLHARAQELRPAARAASVEGVAFFAGFSDQRREDFSDLLRTTGLAALGLIVALAAALAGLRRQLRISAEQGREAAETRRRFASAINASLDAIVVADASGRIMVWNHAAEQVFGYSRSTAVGANMDELIVPANLRAFHRRGIERYVKTGERRLIGAGRQETRALRADGSEAPVEISVAAAHGDDGPIFISYIRDISERIEADRALMRARDEAMAADKAKSEFIAVMSHEMRTPLNGVLGTLDLMARTALTPVQDRYLKTAVASGEILLRHVNDVLDIARIEAKRFAPEPAPFLPEELLDSVALVSRPLVEGGGNRFRVVTDLPPGALVGDARRIQQVLINLLGNAAKFTRGGEVALEAHALEHSRDSALVEFAVRDDGPGVSEADQARIFDDFVTLDASYDRKSGGTGLGLGICRRLIEALGGEIGVDSRPEEGARFWIRLDMGRASADAAVPLTDAPELDAPGGAPTHAGGLRVLVVEDNETNRFVANEMLSAHGHHVSLAEDGKAGVEAAQEARYDLILMDISMPGMDGVAATRAIRARGGPSAAAPIVGLTAHALPEEQERFRAAGMDGCLTKPLRMTTLVSALDGMGLTPGVPAPAPEAEEEAELAAWEEDEDDEDMLDPEVLADLSTALDGPDLAQLLRRAAADLAEGAAEVRRLEQAGDVINFCPTAHRVAGAAALVGGKRLHAVLAAAEAACKREDPETARRALECLEEVVAATLPVLDEIAAGAEAQAEAEAAAPPPPRQAG
ncbi:ATP-binding protein [Rhodovulum sp. DZ06]|uniref:hybrid sensor histidine kinase/response regulator n=1 Tax=Rhodovulum sp. DZ06 TaxID=3425126 RepID=UPI003D353EA2